MREDNVYVFTTTKIMFPLTRSQKEEGINISDIFLQSKLTFFLKFIKRPTNQLFSTCRRGRKKISFIFLLLKSIELHHHVYYTMNITQNTILSILYTITILIYCWKFFSVSRVITIIIIRLMFCWSACPFII